MPHTQLQQDYLQAMGISLWHLKQVPEDAYIFEHKVESEPVKKLASLTPADSVNTKEVMHSEVKPETLELQTTVTKVTQGVDTKNPQHTVNDKPAPKSIQPEPVVAKSFSDLSEGTNTQQSDFISDIMQCQSCVSRTSRLHVLSGQGLEKASVFYISDAPNDDENHAGHYLVDKDAQLFEAMLETIGIEQNFFYTGLVKCHSLQDFVVSDNDIQQCAGFLQQQIAHINPKIIVLQGIHPARALLKTTQTFNQLRGQVHRLLINNKEYSAIVTFHPAYLIRNPIYKREALSDLIRIKQILNDQN